MTGYLKKDPPELVELVRRLYVDEGKTQREVAAEIGLGRISVVRIMNRYGIPPRANKPRDCHGANNSRWRTEGLRYDTLHARVYAARGKPIGCTKCGLDDPERRYEWANLTGNYEDVQDYARMCVPCHRKFDAERRSETGDRTSPYVGGGVRA